MLMFMYREIIIKAVAYSVGFENVLLSMCISEVQVMFLAAFGLFLEHICFENSPSSIPCVYRF